MILKCTQVYYLVLKDLPKLKEKIETNKSNKKNKNRNKNNYFSKNFVEFRDQLIKGLNNLIEEDYKIEEKLVIELYFFILGICDMTI